ncbi:formimidoylglutamate deiminase [Steroidobacter agaridevorans]|uniref:Formimidoylglutamate deiminase n=2 Tax=Steroidobacter agaridevorans TaxID=2695856 RepID=A0A829YF84_9GAMM|nr:formimidoylglutamate deiminase [Steroidobacter agaridevorans]GFE88667.1 formimidoylglutamate deiminase [Steroidobacter agaridevorans]
MQSRYRFTCAWLADGWHRNVVISVDPEGDIVDVSADDTVTAARMINGAAIAGMPNIHSHAFQRAMAGLVEQRGGKDDSFWTWRETMYDVASRITPDCLNGVAAQLYADMVKAGYTSVCEFHYLHSPGDASGEAHSHEQRLAMSQALMDAASTAGIGLTLLPTLYQTSDFGGAPPTERQRQFSMETREYLDLLDALRQSSQRSPQLEVGVALHSLRAVPPESLRAVLDSQRNGQPIHIHIAEQEREVQACLERTGKRPIEWLLDNAPVDRRWCLIHATHATPAELQSVAAAGAVVGLCPTTEANLGDGLFPMETLLEAGGAFAIGSDSHISLSPIEELRWLEYQARLARRQRGVLTDGKLSGGALLWQKACTAGARVSGRPIGELTAGKRADVVVLDMNSPLFAARSDDSIIDTFVFSGTSESVRDVMVGGRWLVQDRRHFAETAVAAGYKRALQKMFKRDRS